MLNRAKTTNQHSPMPQSPNPQSVSIFSSFLIYCRLPPFGICRLQSSTHPSTFVGNARHGSPSDSCFAYPEARDRRRNMIVLACVCRRPRSPDRSFRTRTPKLPIFTQTAPLANLVGKSYCLNRFGSMPSMFCRLHQQPQAHSCPPLPWLLAPKMSRGATDLRNMVRHRDRHYA
jgi:hypothetical protein